MGPSGSSHTEPLTTYLRSESTAAVPNDVERDLRRRIVDTFGAITAGHHVEGIDVTTDLVTDLFGDGACTILDGSGRQRCAPGVALANGLAANALDIDDGSRKAEGHPAAVIVPAALSAAELADASVGTFLDSVLSSYEIAVRTAPAIKDRTGMWNGSGSWGAVGAAAAVARLLDLAPEEVPGALETAAFNAPIAPNLRSVANPGSSMTKDGVGWGSFVGTTAALLAERGLAGSGTVFDTAGWDESDRATLGDRYHLTESYYKPYPGCRWAHPGIDAAFELLDEHDIDVDAIDRVRVYTFEKAIDLQTRYPSNPDQAQYSYAYLLGAALVKGDWLTPSDLDESHRSAPAVREMVDRITFHHDETAQSRYSTAFTARVEIEADGESFTSELTHPRGARERPMTEADHHKKQSLLIDRYLGSGTAANLRELLTDRELPVREVIARIGLR